MHYLYFVYSFLLFVIKLNPNIHSFYQFNCGFSKALGLLIIFFLYFFLKKQRWRLITHANGKSKSEKFPPPHEDGALGFPSGSLYHMDPHFDPPDVPFSSTLVYEKGQVSTWSGPWSGPLVDPVTVGHVRRKKKTAGDARMLVHPSKAPNKSTEMIRAVPESIGKGVL